MTTMISLLIILFLAPNTISARDETALVNETARLTAKYDHGAVTIVRTERQTLPSPRRLPRWRGRFEARAVAADGKPLDFVRFDFPLMAQAEAPEDATEDAKKLGRAIREHVTATTIVAVPVVPGTASVAIYDSVTKKSVSAPLLPAAGGGGSTRK
jgi:hypothetical protein